MQELQNPEIIECIEYRRIWKEHGLKNTVACEPVAR
jgi:hypothetical protein